MKKTLMATLLTTVLGAALAAQPAGPVVAPAGQPTYLSVGTDMLLLDANGQMLGHLNEGGLLLTRGAASDVRTLLVVPGSRYHYRINGIDLAAAHVRRSTPELEWYGPAGQMARLRLPNLQDVRWMTVGGQIQGMQLD